MEIPFKLKENIKAQRLIGLSRRAGALSYGSEGCIKDLKKKKSKLIITSSDISEKTKKELIFAGNGTDIYTSDMTKDELGEIAGTKPTVVLSVKDDNFKKGILEVNKLYGKSI